LKFKSDLSRIAYQAGTGTHKGEGPISGILLYFAPALIWLEISRDKPDSGRSLIPKTMKFQAS